MPDKTGDTIRRIVEKYGGDPGRLMDIARAVNTACCHVPEPAIGEMARALGIPRGQVRSMVSFYAFLSRGRPSRAVIRLCNGVVERMKGADAVGQSLSEALGISFGETTPDGQFTLELTACIGLSDQAPSALINGRPVTNLSVEDVPGLIAALRAGRPVAELPEAKVDANVRQPGAVIFAPMQRGAAVRRATTMTPDEVIGEVNRARLRGRGGAGFPTAMKWDFCRKAPGAAHYLVCNGDEGEPGTFKDRSILMDHPDLLFEGMTVAGYALGATEGLLYLRGEYEYLLEHLEQVLAKRRHLGLLGPHICGAEGFDFDIRIQMGAGAYVCGEESALIESLEGKSGVPRERPPFPVQKGYKNLPTAVNNVETLCCAARILEKGGEWFAGIGTKDSTGTKLLSISGDCEHPGVYEVPYGISIASLLEKVGANETQAVQVGGPSGCCVAPKDFGRSISFEDLSTGGAMIVFGQQRDLLDCMAQFVEFFVDESCGWCAPCRAGGSLLLEVLRNILRGKGSQGSLRDLERIGKTMKMMSRCGLGQTAANPVLTTLRDFWNLYQGRVSSEDYVPSFDLAAALAPGCAVTGRQPDLAGEHV